MTQRLMFGNLAKASADCPRAGLTRVNPLSGRILWWLLVIFLLPATVLLGYWVYFRIKVGAIVDNPKLALQVERWNPVELATDLQSIDLGYGAIQLPSKPAYRRYRYAADIPTVILDSDEPRSQIVLMAPFFDDEFDLEKLKKSFEALGETTTPSSNFDLQRRLLDTPAVSFWEILRLGPRRFVLRLTQALMKNFMVSGAKRFSSFDRGHYSFLVTERDDGQLHVFAIDRSTNLQQGIWVWGNNEWTRQGLNTIVLTYTIKPDATSSAAVDRLVSDLPLRRTDGQMEKRVESGAGRN